MYKRKREREREKETKKQSKNGILKTEQNFLAYSITLTKLRRKHEKGRRKIYKRKASFEAS